MADDVMTRKETMAFISEMMFATLRGEEPPKPSRFNKKYIRSEYLEDAMDMVTRLLSEKFETVPEKVSDDFEVQEVVRQKTDEMVADIVLMVRQTLDGLTKRP